MSTPPLPTGEAAPSATPTTPADGTRPTRPPLTPARIGESIGEDTDPELDVAPNLGGEQQMQDA